MVNLMVEDGTISFVGCVMQFFFPCTFVVTESFLLAVMAFDLFMAICNPLLYMESMSPRLCATLVVGSHTWRVACSLLSHVLLSNYHSKVPTQSIPSSVSSPPCLPSLALILISTRYCFSFLPPLMRPARSASFSCHVFIVVTILNMPSACCRRRAFSTCASHLTAISIFHGTILFLRCVSNSTTSRHTVKVASVFYMVVTPMLNALIYSLRNKDVKDIVSKIMDSKMFSYFLSKNVISSLR